MKSKALIQRPDAGLLKDNMPPVNMLGGLANTRRPVLAAGIDRLRQRRSSLGIGFSCYNLKPITFQGSRIISKSFPPHLFTLAGAALWSQTLEQIQSFLWASCPDWLWGAKFRRPIRQGTWRSHVAIDLAAYCTWLRAERPQQQPPSHRDLPANSWRWPESSPTKSGRSYSKLCASELF